MVSPPSSPQPADPRWSTVHTGEGVHVVPPAAPIGGLPLRLSPEEDGQLGLAARLVTLGVIVRNLSRRPPRRRKPPRKGALPTLHLEGPPPLPFAGPRRSPSPGGAAKP